MNLVFITFAQRHNLNAHAYLSREAGGLKFGLFVFCIWSTFYGLSGYSCNCKF